MRKRIDPFTGKVVDYPPPDTCLCPPGSPPTRETLSLALGVPAPQGFVELVQRIHQKAKGDPYRCVELFQESLGFCIGPGPSDYESAPCEVFPIGYPGVDGVHFGYLVHTLEPDMDDYPVCHFCPADSDGVSIKGVDTYNGIASIMCSWGSEIVYPTTPKWTAAVDEARRTKPSSIPIKKAIQIPTGWRFMPSSDGVGVLAPSSLFARGSVITFDHPHSPEPFIDAASNAMRDGHLASALYYLREGYWSQSFDKPIRLCELMCEVYDKLERPFLVSVMQARIDKWKEE